LAVAHHDDPGDDLALAVEVRGAASLLAARERLLLLGVSARDIDAIVTSGRTRRTLPVRAPIGGHVTRFEAVVGSYVTPATVLYEITDFARVRILASPL